MEKFYTGFESLDNKVNFKKGELVVIASRPAIGKTSLICSIIKNTLEKQKSLLFAMQLTKHKAVENLNGYLDSESKQLEIVKDILDIDEIILKTAENTIKYGLDVVYIDNFTDFVVYSRLLPKSAILKLKDMAKRFNVALVITDQLERNEMQYSTYYDIRHKEFLKRADKILTIYRLDLEYSEEDLEINCIENGTTSLCVDKDKEIFHSLEVRLKFDKNDYTYSQL